MLTGKYLAALENSIFRVPTIDPNTGGTSDMVRVGQKCLGAPRKASRDSSGSLGHAAGSSGEMQPISGAWHGFSVLIGPHKEPHENNSNQDDGEVEEQLPRGYPHSWSWLGENWRQTPEGAPETSCVSSPNRKLQRERGKINEHAFLIVEEETVRGRTVTPTKSLCWNPDTQCLSVWLYLETGSFKR